MANTQTLIWAIDTTKAVKGSKQFQAAVDAAGRSAERFDKRASSSFSKLSTKMAAVSTQSKNIGKGLNTGAFDRFATTAQSRFLSVERSAASLRAKLALVGDTRGITRLNGALATLKTQMLTTSKTTGDLARAQLTYNASIQQLRLGTATAGFATLSASMTRTSGALAFLKSSLGGFVGLLGLSAVIRTADAYDNMRNKLKIVTSGVDQLNDAWAAMVRVSKETRSSLEGNVSLFQRLTQRSKSLGLTQQDNVKIVKSFAQAMQLGGATAQEAASAATQFSQSLIKGLNGDEFRSLAENAPRVMQVFADALGVPIGSLKALGTAGQLTGKVLTDSFLNQAPKLNAEFARLAPTISSAAAVFRTSFTDMIGSSSDATSATARFAQAILFASQNIAPLSAGIAGIIALGMTRWTLGVVVELGKMGIAFATVAAKATLMGTRIALATAGSVIANVGRLAGAMVGLRTATAGAAAAGALLKIGLKGLVVAGLVTGFLKLTGVLDSAIAKFKELKARGLSTAEILEASWNTVTAIFGKVWDAAKTSLNNVWEKTKEVAGGIGDSFSQAWTDTEAGIDGFLAHFDTSFDSMVASAKSGVKRVVDVLYGLVASAKDIADQMAGAFDAMFSRVGSAWDKFRAEGVKAAGRELMKVPGDMMDAYEKSNTDLGANFEGGADKLAKKVTDSASAFTDTIRGGLDTAVKSAQDVAASATKAVGDEFEKQVVKIEKRKEAVVKAAKKESTAVVAVEASTNQFDGLVELGDPVVKKKKKKTTGRDATAATNAARETASAHREAAMAVSDFRRALELLHQQQTAGKITAEEAITLRQRLNAAIKNASDPLARQQAKLAEERILLSMSNEERRVEETLRKSRHGLIQQGVDLQNTANAGTLAAIENQTKLNDVLKDKSGIEGFKSGIGEMQKGLEGLGSKISGDLSTALSDFVMKGKIDFGSMVRSWISDLIKLAAQNTFKQLFSGGGGLFGGSGGGGGIGSMFSSIFGGFRNGGISHNPTQMLNAKMSEFSRPGTPHFANGGTTQGMGGGPIPAILHRNESVVPLKGGAIPVEINGGRGAGGANVTQNVNMTINATDANSFRQKQSHITREIGRQLERTKRRDNY